MGKLIDLAEVRRARQRRVAEQQREALQRAVELIDINLAVARQQLREADLGARWELVERVRKLGALLEYGETLLDSSPDSNPDHLTQA